MNYISNPFTNASGRPLLKALFYENGQDNKSLCFYTLKDQDHMGYPSLFRLYMETADPTEYIFATTHLNGWRHWKELSEQDWFRPYVNRWREELELKLRAEALIKIRLIADSTSNAKLQANKLLLDGGWKSGDSKGRPSKERIKQEAHKLVSDEQLLREDIERMQNLN